MRRTFWGMAFFLWITVVAVLFYIVPQQRPVDGAQLTRWWLLARAGLGLAAIGGSAFSFGLWGLRMARWRAPEGSASAEVRFLAAATLGLGLESAAMLSVGMLGGANGWGAWAVILGGWGLSPREAVRLSRRVARDVARAWRTAGRGLRLYVGGTMLLSGVMAILPPIDWDGLFYHLTGPKLALAAGRIGWLDRAVPHFNFPWLGESLYLLALRTFGEAAPKLLHWWALLLLVGWIAWPSYRQWGARGARWAVVLFLALPMAATLAGMAYTDLFLTLFAVAECALLAEATARQRDGAWFFLAGMLGGLATGVKYTAVTWPLAGAAVTLLYDGVTRSPSRWKRTGLFLAGACGGGFLWPLKNLIFTGNPVYPFVWGGPEWDSVRMAWYQSAGSGLWGDWRAIALLPLQLTMGIRDMNFYDGRTGPLWLILLPVVLAWAWQKGRRGMRGAWFWLTVATLGGAHGLLWLWGVLTTQNLYQSRLLLPALAVYTWPSVAAVMWLRPRRMGSVSLYTFFKLFVSLVLVGNGFYQLRDVVRLRPGAYLMGLETREAYLSRNLGITWGAFEAVNGLPRESKVLFLWEPRTYYATVDAYPDPILDRWNHLYFTYGSAEAIAHALRGQGFTHILDYAYGMNLVRQHEVKGPKPPPEAWRVWDEFVARYLVPVATPDGYVLYTWSVAP